MLTQQYREGTNLIPESSGSLASINLVTWIKTLGSVVFFFSCRIFAVKNNASERQNCYSAAIDLLSPASLLVTNHWPKDSGNEIGHA